MGQDLHEIKPAKFLSGRMENQEAQGPRKFRDSFPFPRLQSPLCMRSATMQWDFSVLQLPISHQGYVLVLMITPESPMRLSATLYAHRFTTMHLDRMSFLFPRASPSAVITHLTTRPPPPRVIGKILQKFQLILQGAKGVIIGITLHLISYNNLFCLYRMKGKQLVKQIDVKCEVF